MWLLPSRRRPESLARFFEAFKATGGSTPGMVLIDSQDEKANRVAYHGIRRGFPLGWSIKITTGETQAEKIAEVWPQVKDCAWLGLIGDDCVPETPVWDQRMVAALDGANMVSCNDGWQAPRRVGNCWIMSGDLVRTVGYIFPPGLQHLYVDDIWEGIGREANCWRVLMDVKVAHRHVLKGEAPADETHQRVYGEANDGTDGMWPGDTEAYSRWLEADRARCIAEVVELRRNRNLHDDDKVKARMARARSRSVLLCTPTHDGKPVWQYTQAMCGTWRLLERQKIRHDLIFVAGCSNLAKARNALCAWFLSKTEFTDMVFIDSDMGWDPGAIIRLLASDKDVIGAVGRKKTEKVSWCLKFLPGSENDLHQDEMGALEIQSIGTGVLKISREALERIAAERPELKLPGDADMPDEVKERAYKYFAFGPQDEGEDYEFCKLWRSIGGSVWVDPTLALVHVGETEYEGRFSDVLTAVAA